MQSLYEWDFRGKDEKKVDEIIRHNIKEFGPGTDDEAFVFSLVRGVLKNREKIDQLIEKCAPEWPLEQVTITDRNVLRLGIFELVFGNYEEVPPKVAIEAQKLFSSATLASFMPVKYGISLPIAVPIT